MSAPVVAAVGDVVEFHLMPGFHMPVLDVRPCEIDSARPEQHDAVKVVDPDGNEDWLCAYDLRVVTA